MNAAECRLPTADFGLIRPFRKCGTDPGPAGVYGWNQCKSSCGRNPTSLVLKSLPLKLMDMISVTKLLNKMNTR
jgi:hypothetical protein